MSEEIVISEPITAPKVSLTLPYHDERSKFLPGNQISRLGGKPKGSFGLTRQMREALKQVEKAKGKKFLVHAIERAFASDKVLPHILDRVEPKLAPYVVGEASGSQLVINIVNFADTTDARSAEIGATVRQDGTNGNGNGHGH